ncbi:hypothetical protein OG440_32925 [Streptomyces sp. NBC_00637]|uniref:hypothetical protein n=1 Tax=Streptomyces sp. NBC_00637 TaxID=2903667 RepID=UPI0032529A97
MTVALSVPAEVINHPDEAALPHSLEDVRAAPIRRTRWSRGPHDTLLRLHSKMVTGFRLARAEA